jgi:exosortase A-associated hydrolase 2
MSLPFHETSGYLSSSGGDLYGTLFLPERLATDTAVVLVEPFGEEKKCAYRSLVRLARALAGAGIPVLRFDLGGTGDSPGEHASADFVGWCADVRAAADVVLGVEGISGWCPIGVRFGALPALQAAVEFSPRAMVLLEPVLGGNECLRDLERRQKIKDMMSGQRDETGTDAATRWQAGETVDFGGFAVSARLAEQLAGVEAGELLAKLDCASALQVIRVSGSAKLPPAWQPLVDAAAGRKPGEVKVVPDKPFWGQLEYYESDAVIEAVLPFLREALHAGD